MIFKTPKVQEEFELDTEPKIVAIALYADWWALREFGHELLVTDVSRNQSEYDRTYPEALVKGPFWVDSLGQKHYAGPMPHLADRIRKLKVRATDFGVIHGELRSMERLSALEAPRLVDHLNALWPRRDGKKTAIYHDVGSGPHVHVQAEIG